MGIQAEGEQVRKAVKWISAERQYAKDPKPLKKLVEEAGSLFDLSPKEAEELSNFFRVK
ncbi:MAG: hypothetical protein K9K88_16195 [Desulfobacterales bacterium]|nr:hypothetical protein [Desulfobacterales bacterium]